MSATQPPPYPIPPAAAPVKKTWPIAVGVGIVMLLIGGGAAFFIRSSSDDEGGEVFTQAEGEIFLEPAAEVGPEPFSATPAAPAPTPAATQQIPASTVTGKPAAAVASSSGRKPGLYGGSSSETVCEPQKIIDFLKANPAKAAAWVAALNNDPTVAAQYGKQLTPADIPAYIATLTPLVLNSDTRVTNHGFRNGKPTPRQAVLQKGSAVLADLNGVPRVRCYCGNPLTSPIASKVKPKYTGGTTGWTTPVNMVVVIVPTTPGSGPFQVTPIGQPNGPLSSLINGWTPTGGTTTPTSGPTTTSGSTSSMPPTTGVTPTTAAPTTAVSTTGSNPTMSGASFARDPSGDSYCASTYGPGSVGLTLTASYSDPDGDAGVVLTGDLGSGHGDLSSDTTFTGGGANGTLTSRLCGTPGTTATFVLGDQQGNGSAAVSLTIP